VEDLCNAAVKEEAIETKLKAVAEQWAQEIFTFADHKSRGPVVLKVGGHWRHHSLLQGAGASGVPSTENSQAQSCCSACLHHHHHHPPHHPCSACLLCSPPTPRS